MHFVRRIILALLVSGALFAGAATPTLADVNPNENCVPVIATVAGGQSIASFAQQPNPNGENGNFISADAGQTEGWCLP